MTASFSEWSTQLSRKERNRLAQIIGIDAEVLRDGSTLTAGAAALRAYGASVPGWREDVIWGPWHPLRTFLSTVIRWQLFAPLLMWLDALLFDLFNGLELRHAHLFLMLGLQESMESSVMLMPTVLCLASAVAMWNRPRTFVVRALIVALGPLWLWLWIDAVEWHEHIARGMTLVESIVVAFAPGALAFLLVIFKCMSEGDLPPAPSFPEARIVIQHLLEDGDAIEPTTPTLRQWTNVFVEGCQQHAAHVTAR